MKCSVFLAQIRAGGGWQLPARGGDGCKRGLGRRAASTGRHGANLGQLPVPASPCVLDIPPLRKGSCKSSGGEALPALPLQRSFAYARLGKERSFMVAVQKS